MSGCKGKCGCIKKLQGLGVFHNDCPKCKAANDHEIAYSFDSPHVEGYIATVHSICEVCKAEWKDYYKFTGKREIIEEPDIEGMMQQLDLDSFEEGDGKGDELIQTSINELMNEYPHGEA